MEPRDLGRATAQFQATLQKVAPHQWSAATPCADWDVRTLVNHVVNELLWIPPLMNGETIAEVGDRFDGDVLGRDPLSSAAAAADGALAAATSPGAAERTVHLSFGDFAGKEYTGQVASDVVIHTWDLARAIGADERLDPSLLATVEEFLAPQVEQWRSAGAFGPAVDVPPDADAQTRFLASTGRS